MARVGASDSESDLLVVGAGLGGVAAALAALRRGCTVVLTEPTDWIGGQLTSQAVPFDEHPWIESLGCTATYRRLRESIRRYYRQHYPLTDEAKARPHLNPGEGTVGPLCHEPIVAWRVLTSMLEPYVATGQLTLHLGHRPIAADVVSDRVTAVRFEDGQGGRLDASATWILDATELGDLLALAEVEHVTGSEARAETGEPHASVEARPDNMQAFSVCFAIEHRVGEDHRIDRPTSYDRWREVRPLAWPDRLLSFSGPNPQTLEPRRYRFDPESDSPSGSEYDLWSYRRIRSRRNLKTDSGLRDVTLVNWPMNDYFLGPIVSVPEAEATAHVEAARELSLSLLYWLQADAPRPDGGTGWPGLRLCGDPLGTLDGFAKAPYVRESRRLRALTTVVEQDVALAVRRDFGATEFRDSVGVGAYRIDLHPSTGGDDYIDVASLPFQIPLGSLIPVRISNLLAAGKNIGTTHITNGCYRLHPVEWSIGEAAGSLAAYCIAGRTSPHAVHSNERLLTSFQAELQADGFELAWPEAVRVGGFGERGAD